MTGKELILAAIDKQKVERIPWVPFSGVHSASLINKTATEFLKSADLIIEGQNKAIKRYKADGIPVVFDLQIEAEILGCQLNWSDDNPPAVISHPLSEGSCTLEELSLFDETAGRMPIVLDATRRLRKEHEDLALYGLITGPFTLALHLLGAEIFMMMFDSPEQINKILDFCAEIGKKMSQMYLDNGCDIIAVVDPMTSQIGPDQFKEFCSKPCTKIFDYIKAQGGKSSFFVCGHAQNNIEVMCDCHCDNISIDENISLDYVKEICLSKGVSFGGNMQLTTVMLLGTPDANKVNAFECMEIGGTEGFILAPGCDMPFATPPENVEAIANVIHDEYQQEVARKLAETNTESCPVLDMSEYGLGDKVIIDVITLDSEACAPCQYMVEAVRAVAPEFGDLLVWREHKIKTAEAITMMSSLYVRNIPTICIDGQIKFVSRIPPRNELIAAIRDRIKEKFSMKIKYHRGKIALLGNPEDQEFLQIRENIEIAMKELGRGVEYEEITDDEEIRKYGVFKVPAVITEKYALKSCGKVAEKDIIKEWIKALDD
jgi:uroporphyrinogen decarboxylase